MKQLKTYIIEKLVINKNFKKTSPVISYMNDFITVGEISKLPRIGIVLGYELQKNNINNIIPEFDKLESYINTYYETFKFVDLHKNFVDLNKTIIVSHRNDRKILIYKKIKDKILVILFSPLLVDTGVRITVTLISDIDMFTSGFWNLNLNIMYDDDFIELFKTICNNDKYKTSAQEKTYNEILSYLENNL